MRVLHILDSLDPRYGGPVRAVFDLSSQAINYGIESEFAGFSTVCETSSSESSHIFRITPPKAYRHAPDFEPWLKANLHRFDGVVIHSVWVHWGWVASRECALGNVPYACFPHGMLEPWPVRGQGLFKFLKKRVYWSARERHIVDAARCLLFTTDRERRLSQQTFSLGEVPMRVIPYGVRMTPESEEFVPEGDLRAIAGRPYALFLGRVHPKKNPHLLLSAWAEAAPKDWLLVIAGPSSAAYSAKLHALRKDLDLEAKVIMLDFVNGGRKAWLFRNAKWFLLPSSQENFAVAAFEALQYGCPVVLSDQVALAEQMSPNTPVLPVQISSWARFFSTTLPDERQRQKIRESQVDHARAQFDLEQIGAGWSQSLIQIFAKR